MLCWMIVMKTLKASRVSISAQRVRWCIHQFAREHTIDSNPTTALAGTLEGALGAFDECREFDEDQAEYCDCQGDEPDDSQEERYSVH